MEPEAHQRRRGRNPIDVAQKRVDLPARVPAEVKAEMRSIADRLNLSLGELIEYLWAERPAPLRQVTRSETYTGRRA